jgi:hypothetical protein
MLLDSWICHLHPSTRKCPTKILSAIIHLLCTPATYTSPFLLDPPPLPKNIIYAFKNVVSHPCSDTTLCPDKSPDAIPLSLVLRLKNRLKHFVCCHHDKDKNRASWHCPKWVAEKYTSLFYGDHKHFEKLELSESEALLELKKQYFDADWDAICAWDNKGTLPSSYITPKAKAPLSKFRPLVSFLHHPMKKLLKIQARALLFLLDNIKLKGFSLIRIPDLKSRIIDLQSGIDDFLSSSATNNPKIRTFLADVKNMYTELPHDVIIKAVNWLIGNFTKSSVRKNGFIIISKDLKTAEFKRKAQKGKFSINMQEIYAITVLSITNAFLRFGKSTILRQILGIAMGSPDSPMLAVIVCAFTEFTFYQSIDISRHFFGAMRYMDDVYALQILDGTDASFENLAKATFTTLTKSYAKGLVLKEENQENGKATFLEAIIFMEDSQICLAHYNKNSEAILHSGHQAIARFLSVKRSWCHMSSMKSMILGALLKLPNLSNSDYLFRFSLQNQLREFRFLGVPRPLLKNCLKRCETSFPRHDWSPLP